MRAVAEIEEGTGGDRIVVTEFPYQTSVEVIEQKISDLVKAGELDGIDVYKRQLRRGVNTVGPHRDDLVLVLEGREARTHASQGEQRCLALALRMGVHQLVMTKTPHTPILLLDDVFSELDPSRSRALIAELPPGQSVLTTAAPLPAGIEVAEIVDIARVVQEQ